MFRVSKVGQLLLSSEGTPVSLKSLRKGSNFNPNQGHRNWKKGCFFEKITKKFKKRGLLGPTHRTKNNIFLGFRQKGGVKFELKIREKGQFSGTLQ